MSKVTILRLLATCAFAALLTACGGDSEQTATTEVQDVTQEVQEFYAANPELITFATPEDLPNDLIWEDGMDLPDIGSPEAKKGGTYYDWLEDFPPTLRPTGPDSNSSARNWVSEYFSLTYASPHPDVEGLIPGVAQSWAVSTERKTVYVKIHPDARWTDDVPITADDALFAFFFYLSDYIQAPFTTNYFKNEFSNITKYDDLTFSVTVTRLKPDMATIVLWMPPVPQHFYKELGEDYPERYQWRYAPHAGPYYLQESDIDMGVRLVLRRKENWWAEDHRYYRYRFNPDRISLTVIRDTAKRYESFRRGDLDLYELRTAELWYDETSDTEADVANGYLHKSTFYNQYPRTSWGLWMNSSRPLLDNVDVRLGIQYAINWDVVLRSYFRGDLERLKRQNQGYPEFEHPDLPPRPFDIDKAVAHFGSAGFTERGPDGILVNEQGQRLSFTLSTHYERFSDVFTILKEEAIKAGLEFRIEMMDGAAGFRKALEKQHDMYFVGFVQSPGLYPELSQHMHSKYAYDQAFLEDGSINPDRKVIAQGNNLEVIADYELDQLIDQYIASEDREEMRDLAFQIQQIHYDHASYSPGFVEPFYRTGYWRWVRWPEGFNSKTTVMARELFVHWIDEEMKGETLEARVKGQAFELVNEVYDQYRIE